MFLFIGFQIRCAEVVESLIMKVRLDDKVGRDARNDAKADGPAQRSTDHQSAGERYRPEDSPTRIRGIERAAGSVGIRLLGRGEQRVHGEELRRGGVVVAGAQVVEPALAVAVLSRREAILLLILAVVNAFRSRIEIGRWPRAPYLGLRLILVEDFRGLADAGRGGVGRRTPLKSAARGGARRAGGPRPPTLAVESGGSVAIAWG
jgi:hypothetical protein